MSVHQCERCSVPCTCDGTNDHQPQPADCPCDCRDSDRWLETGDSEEDYR